MDDRERDIRLADERWRRALSRKGKRRDPLSRQRDGSSSFHHAGDTYRSRILSEYAPFKPFKSRKWAGEQTFTVPADFSLTDNPNETLRFFREIVGYARTAKTPKLFLDHRKMKSLGLAADSALGVLLQEISLENRYRRNTRIRGMKPLDQRMRRLMDEIGCVRVLLSGVEDDIKLELRSGAKVFRHQNRKRLHVDALTLDPTSAAARDFADHLNTCLGSVGRRLTDGGMLRLLSYVGEILGNAQEHSGLAAWTIVGYIDLSDDQLTYRCTIMSFGNSIFDTFAELKPQSVAYRQIAPYIAFHAQRGNFSDVWREEDLVAVLALQGYISSKQIDSSGDRGQGTVDFIEFFQSVLEDCAGTKATPRMSVLTGRTLIKFDGRYKMAPAGTNARMTIAFNESNSLFDVPDTKAVIALPVEYFPGVAISISIPLAKEVVEEVHGKEDEN